MISENERAKILEMIEDGTITAEQGLTLLNALGESSMPLSENASEEVETYSVESRADHPTGTSYITKEIESYASEENSSSSPYSPPHETWTEDHPGSVEVELYQEPEPFEGEAEVMEPDPGPPDTDEINKWKRWWVIPFWFGAGITVIGGLLMYWAFSANGFGFWFACAWFPFLLGVAALALAWGSRTTPWLHVRVHQAPGETPQKIAISFPIPVRLTAWGLKAFGHHIPHMEGTNLDEVILALNDVAKDGTPLFVDVNEGENGEHVQVFIG